MLDFAIETVGLEKTYRARFSGSEIRAVSNVSLRVPVGVKYGLLGPNGAGKTSFVKILLSAVKPTAGSAKIFGLDARDPEARRPVGYLPENHRFPTYLTGFGMLDFYGALSGVPARERKQRVAEYLDLVGLTGWSEVRIKKYSKGMLQRLGLAQALFHEPRLLILDEPTDGVDPMGRRQIHDILNQLTGSGTTVFINSHLLSEVESFCDYVAILRNGQLALEGKISELLTQSGYRITVSGLPSGALDEIRRMRVSILPDEARVTIQAATRDEANAVVDKVRAAGGFLEEFSSVGRSLEELFIQATTQTTTERAA